MTVERLKEYGLSEMTDEEIQHFLSNKGYGVLGFPDDPAPYLIPMSFGYEGGSSLYFTFFVSEQSRKRDLADRSSNASFLVFSPDSTFFWESVVLTGTISRLSDAGVADHEAALENAWRLDIFEQPDSPGSLVPYEFAIENQRGFKHTGLPPAFAGDRGEDSPD